MAQERIQLMDPCPARWEDMTPCAGGRFCSSCAKPVMDFTTWDRENVLRYHKEHPGTCGNHLPEQLDPSLVPISHVAAQARRGFFAALAALSLNGLQAQQRPDPAPTEQLPGDPSRAIAPVQDRVARRGPGREELRNGHPTCPIPDPSTIGSRTRWYISSRFPFVHHARRIRTIGCPSF